MNAHGNWLTAALPFVIVAVVVGLRLRSMSRERPLKVGTLWVVPVVYLLLVGWILFALPPTALGWALLALGLVVGAGLGWHRGKLIRIDRNPETGDQVRPGRVPEARRHQAGGDNGDIGERIVAG